ncbi:MAG: Gfo/Idh/MocA family protein [Calditrichaceae bacterium]
MSKIKLGIIGTGLAAKKLHWPALKKLNDLFEIKMVCNHTEPKAKEFAMLAGNIPYVLDYHELMSHKNIEAVSIILPIHLNYPVTRDALKSGKHVMVEKPLAANLHQGKNMLALDKKYPHVKMVAENFRYRNTFKRVTALMEEGQAGKIHAAVWNVFHHVEGEINPYAKTEWRIKHQYPGGFITDGGVHYIAAIRELFGEITDGYAWTASINPGIGTPDSMSFQFRTDRNVSGLLNLFFTTGGIEENRLVILGDRGSVITENNRIILKKINHDDLVEETDDGGGYMGEYLNFYEAIRHGELVDSSFEKAYIDLKIILSALKSAENKRRIRA